MEQSPSWEANSHPINQEIPKFVISNPKAYYCGHTCLPLVPILSQMNPVHTFPCISVRSILIACPLCLALLRGLFPSSLLTKILNAFLIWFMCYMPHPSHPPLLHPPNNVYLNLNQVGDEFYIMNLWQRNCTHWRRFQSDKIWAQAFKHKSSLACSMSQNFPIPCTREIPIHRQKPTICFRLSHNLTLSLSKCYHTYNMWWAFHDSNTLHYMLI